MVINERVFHFVSRSLETCLAGSCNPNPGTARSDDPTKVPLHLIDLRSAGFNGGDPRLLKVVHRMQIPNLGTVEWATLSYARGQIAPRRGCAESIQLYINEGVVLDEIKDDMETRLLAPQDALQDAVRIVKDLGIRYLWIDVLCPCWDTDDNDGWVEGYANTFLGAKVSIMLPDYDCPAYYMKEYQNREPEEDEDRMERVYEAYLKNEDPRPATQLDATLFLYPFFTDRGSFFDRLFAPRKLFCLENGDAIWACAHHCTHSRYNRLHVDPRRCILNIPKYKNKFNNPRRPPSTWSVPSLPPAERPPQILQAGVRLGSPQKAWQDRSTRNVDCRITKGPNRRKSRKKSPKDTLRGQALIQAWIESLDAEINSDVGIPSDDIIPSDTEASSDRQFSLDIVEEFHRDYALDPPCWTTPVDKIPLPSYSALLEGLSCCYALCLQEDPSIGLQGLNDHCGMTNLNLAPWIFDLYIGRPGEDLIWCGDVVRSWLSKFGELPRHSYDTPDLFAYMASWLHWGGEKAFLSSHWRHTELLTSNCDGTPATVNTRGSHPLFKSIGKQPRGFEIRCARWNEPCLGFTGPGPRDEEADSVFAALERASFTGRSTFLGAGIDGQPWGYDPPTLRWSRPCYIYDEYMNLMGRGVVNDADWFTEELDRIYDKEQREIDESVRRGVRKPAKLKNRRIVTLSFLQRETLELRAADVPLPLPWATDPVFCISDTCVRHHRGERLLSDRVALGVHYGMILLTSGGGGAGSGSDGNYGSEGEDEDEPKVIDTDLYDRVGVFEVYGETFASDRAKQIYLR